MDEWKIPEVNPETAGQRGRRVVAVLRHILDWSYLYMALLMPVVSMVFLWYAMGGFTPENKPIIGVVSLFNGWLAAVIGLVVKTVDRTNRW